MCVLFLRIRRPPRSTQSRSSAASDVYKRQTALYINAVTEYANWAVKDEKEREKFYQQAVDYGKKIIKENKDNWYLYYTLGAAYGRLAQFKGIVSSLFMLGDFDANIKKSIELNPSNYLGYVALGMRYRDVPLSLIHI